jgi:hypothetical protein
MDFGALEQTGFDSGGDHASMAEILAEARRDPRA